MKSVMAARAVAVQTVNSYNLDYDPKYKKARAIGSGDSHMFYTPMRPYECIFFYRRHPPLAVALRATG